MSTAIEPLVAPWSEEKDERTDGVVLVYQDNEIKQTVRRVHQDAESGEPAQWYVVDWEIEEFEGTSVWAPRWTFTVDQLLLDAIAKLPPCEHDWIDMTNQVVSGTDWCRKCGALRAQGDRLKCPRREAAPDDRRSR